MIKPEKQRIFPFLWIDETVTESVVKSEIDRIRECGLGAFCVESRVFSDFCGEKWFDIFGKILRYAEKCGMRVWLLDDKCYPTGIANGAIERGCVSLRQKHLILKRTDAVGPAEDVRFLLREKGAEEDEVLGVFLAPTVNGVPDISRATVLAERYSGNFVKTDIPDGRYAVLTICLSYSGSELPNYIDTLRRESSQALIGEVYEPHYRRFGKEFGKTFAGFFSDEPRIGNGVYDYKLVRPNVYGYELGREGMAYAWTHEMAQKLSAKGFSAKDLLSLWYCSAENTAQVRREYMNEVSREYSENFVRTLADWCHAHGALYAGHVIEDNGNHARAGSGTAHFFRSQNGADFSSVDIVLHQIKPYCNSERFFSAIEGGYAAPEFFNSALPVLAASDAALDENKHGNALCEIFGAFGWGESVNSMLWMINNMLVHGVNAFIPHAFSAVFPNSDCPPHFNARGTYPGFYGFCELMKYASEVCERFSGGERYAYAAVLYNAEAEWSGQGCYPLEKICHALDSRQIPFDIVPYDAIRKAEIKGGKLCVGKRGYYTLVVPESRGYPSEMTQAFERIEKNVPVYTAKDNTFADKLGEEFAKNSDAYGVREKCSELRIMRYDKNGKTEYMIFNAGIKRADTVFEYPSGKIPLALGGGESLILPKSEETQKNGNFAVRMAVKKADTVLIDCFGKEHPLGMRQIERDFNSVEGFGEFSGKAQIKFTVENIDALQIDYRGEYLRITADETHVFIKSPVLLAFEKAYCGEITLETANTLAYRERDYYSKYAAIEPFGINDITILKKRGRVS